MCRDAIECWLMSLSPRVAVTAQAGVGEAAPDKMAAVANRTILRCNPPKNELGG